MTPASRKTATIKGKQQKIPAQTLHQLFEEQVKKNPHAIAIEDSGTGALTYTQLNEKSDYLAKILVQMGIGPESFVGISVNRSLDMAIGLLGILKAGGAYVPLDPNYPRDRLDFIVQDTSMPLILAQQDTLKSLTIPDTVTVILLDDNLSIHGHCTSETIAAPQATATPHNPAYVLYTSGSTGKPKGVVVEHQNVANYAMAAIESYGITACDRIMQFFSLNFDGSVEELFPPWLAGSTVILRTEEISSSIDLFLDFIRTRQISMVSLPTAYWHEWVHAMEKTSHDIPPCLKTVIVGGEAVSNAAYQDWKKQTWDQIKWFNSYGPTECTVVATIFSPEAQENVDKIPIGIPIANTEIHVVDTNLNPVARGESGELLIGGAGVARGYLNREDLTSKAFIKNPFGPGRLYRTGDRVTLTPDGQLLFEGRMDDQIKISGFRIEPGEIEAILETHPMVSAALVTGRRDMGSQNLLVAYITMIQPYPTKAKLRAFLQERVPAHMVPSAFQILETFPLTPNGKVDRQALPDPLFQAPLTGNEFQSPVSIMEHTLVDIWEKVLDLQRIGVTDSFFDLGGNSLLAVRLCTEMEARIQQKGLLPRLFKYPTVRRFAESLENALPMDTTPSSLISIQSGQNTHPLFFVHVLGHGLRFCRPLIHCLGSDLTVYGLSVHFVGNPLSVRNSVEKLASIYIQDMQRIQPKGPYQLAGVSFGGMVAYEMTRQLKSKGESVHVLALLDTVAPDAIQEGNLGKRLLIHWAHLRDQGMGYIVEKFKWRYRRYQRYLQIIQYRLMTLYLKFYKITGLPLTKTLTDIAARNDNRDADKGYNLRAMDQDILLFKSMERTLGVSAELDPKLGWTPFVKGELRVYEVPSSHLGMLEEPHVKVLADQLRPHLL